MTAARRWIFAMIGRVTDWLFRPHWRQQLRKAEAQHRHDLAGELNYYTLAIAAATDDLRKVRESVGLLQMRKALYDRNDGTVGHGGGGGHQRPPDIGHAPAGT